jgi:elongation factor P--beta-lysine ligase
MPPSAGIALGMDRLAMILANQDKIDTMVAFVPESL